MCRLCFGGFAARTPAAAGRPGHWLGIGGGRPAGAGTRRPHRGDVAAGAGKRICSDLAVAAGGALLRRTGRTPGVSRSGGRATPRLRRRSCGPAGGRRRSCTPPRHSTGQAPDGAWREGASARHRWSVRGCPELAPLFSAAANLTEAPRGGEGRDNPCAGRDRGWSGFREWPGPGPTRTSPAGPPRGAREGRCVQSIRHRQRSGGSILSGDAGDGSGGRATTEISPRPPLVRMGGRRPAASAAAAAN